MALRTIRVQGDSVLTKKSRTVDKMTPRIGELITDMLDTMYDAMGVGLAAPQVGILKRIVVIDVGEGPIVLINPEILETSGEQTGDEGCLSVPGMAGQVTRPNYVKVKALDVNMNEQIYEGEGLLARAICHECDHLDGILYVIAQVIGAIAAGFAVVKLLPTSEQVAAKVWLTPAVNGFENGSVSYSLLTQYGITFSITLAIVVEVVASLIVVATAMSSLGDHGESSDRHVIAMGLAYGLATAISYPVTGAGLNPARSTGIALAAMNEGLTQNPLQQLWVFWISPVLAAAVVALVMIIAQMMTTPKVPAAADLPQTDADANADTLDDGEFFDQAASSDGDSAEKDVAEESKEAEVGNQQADSQGDADEGVERH